MKLDRRQFLATTGLGAAALATASSPVAAAAAAADPVPLPAAGDWAAARAAFALSPDLAHLSAMLFASHPANVRAAIERHRAHLDADPAGYLHDNNSRLTDAAFAAAAAYLGVEPAEVALTGSTTDGVGLVYAGVRLRAGQEILTTAQDYYVTHEAARLAAARSGASIRRVDLYTGVSQVSEDGIADRILSAVRPETRVVGLTWVHSSTGLKIPVRAIADGLAGVNADRDEADHALLVIDGVHGFGNQDVAFADLGCDFLIAGCHKWLFGPRGTGIVAATRKGLDAVSPLIPTFNDDAVFSAWLAGEEPGGRTTGPRLTPGGFRAFEHLWALPDIFAFHDALGRGAIAERTAELASRLKQGLADMRHVTLRTPHAAELSAGIVSFDLAGWSPNNAVRGLRERGVIASVAPYVAQHIRLTPSFINTPEDVDRALAAVADMTGEAG